MALIVNLWSGDPGVGLWCPKCKLPSGIRVPLYSVSEHGVSSFARWQKCRDCGAMLPDEGPS